MNIQEAYAYLEQVRACKGMVLGLENMRRLLQELGNPQDQLKVVQIAGTNGKGSTAAFLSNILMQAGIVTGRYTSPAVFSVLEQYWVNGEQITEEEYAQGVTVLAQAAQRMQADCGMSPTAFELETALAFWHFAEKKCGMVVLETGMGGDMDATNVVTTTVCSILTSISMDHSRILGNTLAEIAGHKAGIIKKGVPVISIGQKEPAMAVIRGYAEAQSAPLSVIRLEEPRVVFADKRGSVLYFQGYEQLKLRQLGMYQGINASLAVKAAELLLGTGESTEAAIRKGLEQTQWGGRFERIAENPDMILDGAHNPDGIQRLKESINRYYGTDPITYVMGVLADKDYETEVETLFARAAGVITVTPVSPRAMDKESLKQVICSRYPDLEVQTAPNVAAALDMAAATGNTVVVCGTLTIMAEARQWAEKQRRPVCE